MKRSSINSMNKMLRVVMISPLPPEKFGEAKYTTELIARLVQYKQLEIIAITGTGAQPLEVNGKQIETHSIWDHASRFYPIRLARHICRLRPHLVHVQFGPYGKLFGGLFGELMLVLLILLKLVGIKTTVTLHSTWMPSQVQQRVKQYSRLGRFAFLAPSFFRLYMKLLDKGTTSIQLSTVKIGSELRREFIRQYRVRSGKVFEIPHPFDNIDFTMERDEAKTRLDIHHRHMLLIFGFVRRGKGLGVAIEAMKRIISERSDVLLLIAGTAKDDDSRRYLEEMRERTRDLGIESNVRFETKFIPDDEVPIYFSAASLVLVPYTESVGASGPIHNYASLGVPIVAASVGLHMPETLGGEIVLFKDGNSADLARQVIRLLEMPDIRERAGEKQRAYAIRESWELAARRTLANYLKTLGL